MKRLFLATLFALAGSLGAVMPAVHLPVFSLPAAPAFACTSSGQWYYPNDTHTYSYGFSIVQPSQWQGFCPANAVNNGSTNNVYHQGSSIYVYSSSQCGSYLLNPAKYEFWCNVTVLNPSNGYQFTVYPRSTGDYLGTYVNVQN